MPVRAVLFDLDGTLLDTLADIAAALNSVLTGMGLPPHSCQDVSRFVGEGVTRLVWRSLPEGCREPERVEEAVARMRVVYGERLCVETRPYDGIPDLLDELQARAIPAAILSNKPHALTVRLVREALGRWNFAVVRGENPPVPRKPDPTSARSIATRLDVESADILYVGDTPTDVQTARAAGMHPVGVAWGFRRAEVLREAGAAVVLSHPLDLLPLLDR